MLTKADNELLVRTGPGTPMGDLFRRFWAPVMLADELGGPDSAAGARQRPRRASGRVSRHRTASSACSTRTARTGARTCFGAATKKTACAASITAGSSTSTASARICRIAPKAPTLKNKVQTTSYPVARTRRHHLGLSWARPTRCRSFRQSKSSRPARSSPHHQDDRARQLRADARRRRRFEPRLVSAQPARRRGRPRRPRRPPTRSPTSSPRWFTAETDYGMMLSAQRNAGPDTFQWRVNQFLMPYAR